MISIFNPPLPTDNSFATYWTDTHGSAQSLAIANAAAKCAGPLLLVCENNEQVEQFKRELKYFCAAHAGLDVFSLSDWETLPYDSFSPHQDIISDRLSALYHLPLLRQGIVVLSVSSLMHKLPPHKYIATNSLDLSVGQTLHVDQVRQQLVNAGYQAVDSVHEHGEFAVRGSIIDLFPMGSLLPYRIDLLDEEIETLRSFDPESQRSAKLVQLIKLLPGHEYPLDAAGIKQFRQRFRETFDIDVRTCPLYQDVSEGINSPGLEYYLALFFTQLDSLFSFLPATTTVCTVGNLKLAGDQFWKDINTRYQDRKVDRFRPILAPDQIFIAIDFVFAALHRYPQINFRDSKAAFSFATRELPNLSGNSKLSNAFGVLQKFMGEQPGRILFCAESAGRRETLLEILKQIGVQPRQFEHWQDFINTDERCGIIVAPIDQGMWLPAEQLVMITEAQLFGDRVAQRRRRRRTQSNTDFIIKSLTELHLADAVVHIDHGIGRYLGLQTLTTDGQTNEFLMLEYANQAKLYVPVTSLHLISRYSGGEQEQAPLNSLGTDTWQKTKRKAAEKIHDVAAELLEIYARREAKKGFQYNCEGIEYEKFAASFPFEETADQEMAIESVLGDMQAGRSMDRLICGDVGFGKTEVAMRAAFVAVQNNKQVALLVPTTLLAQQHFESFKDRFADWPIAVDVISRFCSSSEQSESLKRVASGKIDILIGTHKLLYADINYSNLGLLIIDEEHRFGVRQKEQLKALRANVDILTLTATPIPRTLNMALSNIRDLSLIVTPPARRLSIKTFIREQQDSLVQEAVSRELLRGGQVFYLHNEVKSIDRAAEHLQEIVPQARICVAHGQMAERDLEKAMADFYHKRYNILVCTTIIETGIDIPSANTILIHRADKFGLAQLHQLRGRVGRSHHQAYAYLLLPSPGRLAPDAQKRIDAIQAASSLGAGFTLASHDLEIRGAGELLGDEQSGHMQKIGFSLYTEMLEETVKAIKSGRTPNLESDMDKSIDINLRIPALIPENYLPDVHTRLIMYKRISAAGSQDELNELQVEMIDRFGLLPESLQLLFRLTQLKLRAAGFGIKKIDANINSGRIEFGQHTLVDPMSLVKLIQNNPKQYKLGSANQLQFIHDSKDARMKLQVVNELLDRFKLAQPEAA
ncbi:MAG: transcription-repair coupling factor [Gammaproteobacteria bacterium]|nr:transcription-repair coupling factor [Gammaproteobacteria bacterium]